MPSCSASREEFKMQSFCRPGRGEELMYCAKEGVWWWWADGNAVAYWCIILLFSVAVVVTQTGEKGRVKNKQLF